MAAPAAGLLAHLPAAPLLAAIQEAVRGRGVPLLRLLGDAGVRAYYRARQEGTVTLYQAEQLCDLLGCHPYELYGAAYHRLALAGAPGPLEAQATVTAWHQAVCARPGCGQSIVPGDRVGLVAEVGACCATCCGLPTRVGVA